MQCGTVNIQARNAATSKTDVTTDLGSKPTTGPDNERCGRRFHAGGFFCYGKGVVRESPTTPFIDSFSILPPSPSSPSAPLLSPPFIQPLNHPPTPPAFPSNQLPITPSSLRYGSYPRGNCVSKHTTTERERLPARSHLFRSTQYEFPLAPSHPFHHTPRPDSSTSQRPIHKYPTLPSPTPQSALKRNGNNGRRVERENKVHSTRT